MLTIRNFLLRLLAGKSMILINAHIKGTIIMPRGTKRAYVYKPTFDPDSPSIIPESMSSLIVENCVFAYNPLLGPEDIEFPDEVQEG